MTTKVVETSVNTSSFSKDFTNLDDLLVQKFMRLIFEIISCFILQDNLTMNVPTQKVEDFKYQQSIEPPNSGTCITCEVLIVSCVVLRLSYLLYPYCIHICILIFICIIFIIESLLYPCCFRIVSSGIASLQVWLCCVNNFVIIYFLTNLLLLH